MRSRPAKVIFAVLTLSLVSGVPLAARAQDLAVNRIIASIDGEPITMYDLVTFAKDNNSPLPDGTGAQAVEMRRAALKALIQQKLMEQEMQTLADKIDQAAIDRYISRVAQNNHVTEDELRAKVLQEGMTWEEYRKKVKLDLEKTEMIDRQVRDKVTISNSQIEAYYKSHPDEFMVSQERFKLAQVMIAVPADATPAQVDAARKKAQQVRKLALKGQDFATLARTYSDDDSKSQGGELGEFKPDDMLDEIRLAIANLKTGDISPVIRSKHGFHVIKVEEHERPGVQPLDEVRDQIRNKLQTPALEAQFKRWIDDDLIKSHHVESFL